MRGVASAQISPQARTCVVLGSLDAVEGLDLRRYRHVLWFAPSRARMPARFGLAAEALAVEPLEQFDRGRIGAVLERFVSRDALYLPSLILTAETTGPLAASFLPVVEEILAQFEGIQRARSTRQADGFLWQKQLLANLPEYLCRRVSASWAGALDGVPAFVVGAGPSLDVSLPALAKHADRALVLAADSALRALTEWNVPVDFGFTIDAHKTPAKCAPSEVQPPARLILSTVSPVAWREVVGPERRFFLSARQVTEDWLASAGFPKTQVLAVENCGIAALELAVFLGCRPIYLFGLDHAVDSKDPAKWHQQSVNDGIHKHIGFSPEKNYPKVPGNYQEEIATPLFREWRTLDALCAAYPPGLVTNVIDRGAKLRNTKLVHPEQFAPPGSKVDRTARLGRLAAMEMPPNTARVVAEVAQIAENAEPLIAAARSALEGSVTKDAIRYLATAFQDANFRSVMGNYCLKIMPHLLQADPENNDLWSDLVSEVEQLIMAAKAAG